MVLRSGVGFLEAWICTPQAVDSDPRGHPYDPHGEVGLLGKRTTRTSGTPYKCYSKVQKYVDSSSVNNDPTAAGEDCILASLERPSNYRLYYNCPINFITTLTSVGVLEVFFYAVQSMEYLFSFNDWNKLDYSQEINTNS